MKFSMMNSKYHLLMLTFLAIIAIFFKIDMLNLLSIRLNCNCGGSNFSGLIRVKMRSKNRQGN